MPIEGIDAVTYGVSDMDLCNRFLNDWGLGRVSMTKELAVYETENGAQVQIRPKDHEALPSAFCLGPTIREVTWGVSDERDLDRLQDSLKENDIATDRKKNRVTCFDPSGLHLAFQISRRREVEIEGTQFNVIGARRRIDKPAPIYSRARPVSIGHLVLNVPNLDEVDEFYRNVIGFHLSDRYPGDAAFLRCRSSGEHHNLFLLKVSEKSPSLNHLAFEVRDIHEIIGGGMHIAREGWQTVIGPGRHPVSSAYFWYVRSPCGGLVEYYSDVDYVSEKWEPRDCKRSPENFAEWAIDEGIDGFTRRQRELLHPE